MKTLFVAKSGNRKVGPIPVTYRERKSCPPSCPQYRKGCYGDDFHTSLAWNRADRSGLTTPQLAAKIAALPDGQLWRGEVVGDIVGKGEWVDAYELGLIVRANMGRKGFTYSHKKSAQAIRWIRHANAWGYTINLSADDAGEADRLADLKAGPVVCIVPVDTPEHSYTPAGRAIVICPAQTRDYMTCSVCQLCQKADRKSIVGFRAHGAKTNLVNERASRVIPIVRAK
jgi:hypothetical protein